MHPKYNGEKADIFSCGATLFMMYMQCQPFKKAVVTDPYYKRLSSTVKQNYWKIFKNISIKPDFKELIEKSLQKYPS
jgi:serine/threonine protein kinase